MKLPTNYSLDRGFITYKNSIRILEIVTSNDDYYVSFCEDDLIEFYKTLSISKINKFNYLKFSSYAKLEQHITQILHYIEKYKAFL